jgi:hypothetical protein
VQIREIQAQKMDRTEFNLINTEVAGQIRTGR